MKDVYAIADLVQLQLVEAYKFVKAHPDCTREEIVDAVGGQAPLTAEYALAILRDVGLVEERLRSTAAKAPLSIPTPLFISAGVVYHDVKLPPHERPRTCYNCVRVRRLTAMGKTMPDFMCGHIKPGDPRDLNNWVYVDPGGPCRAKDPETGTPMFKEEC